MKPLLHILCLAGILFAIPCLTPHLEVPTSSPTFYTPQYLAMQTPGSAEFSLDSSYHSKYFAFFFDTSGEHQVSAIDNNSNAIPDYVEDIGVQLDSIYEMYIQPELWGAPPLLNDSLYPVYFQKLQDNYYGYVQPNKSIGDNPNTPAVELDAYDSYMVLRNTYGSFENPQEALLATLAHEFLHSIQFGYDAFEEKWLIEGQATSMEYWVYPELRDNFQFLSIWYNHHDASLHYNSVTQNQNPDWNQMVYSIWPFFYQLYEEHNGLEIGAAISRSSAKFNSQLVNTSLLSLDDALVDFGSSIREEYSKFAIKSLFINQGELSVTPAIDFKEYFPSLFLNIENTLNIRTFPYHYLSDEGNGFLRTNGFDLIELSFDQPMYVELETLQNSEQIYWLQLDTNTTPHYDYSQASAPLFLEPNPNGKNTFLMIFNFDNESANVDYELSFQADHNRINQFCKDEEQAIVCGSTYDINGKLKATQINEFMQLVPGRYYQKKDGQSRPLILK